MQSQIIILCLHYLYYLTVRVYCIIAYYTDAAAAAADIDNEGHPHCCVFIQPAPYHTFYNTINFSPHYMLHDTIMIKLIFSTSSLPEITSVFVKVSQTLHTLAQPHAFMS